MLGSQAIDFTSSVSGLDIGVPEVFRFGFADFPTALATNDSWAQHDGAGVTPSDYRSQMQKAGNPQ